MPQSPQIRVEQVMQGIGDRPDVGDFHTMLAAAQAGSGWAFERLFRTYAPRVSGYLRARGAVDSDELTNDVFLSVFRSLTRFEGDESAFRGWLFTIARNRLVDKRRRDSRRVDTVPADLTYTADIAGGDVEVEALGSLGDEWATAVLRRLAPDQRDVLLLRIVADLTIDQIAELLGKRQGAVKALQRRGLASVRRILDRQGVPLGKVADV